MSPSSNLEQFVRIGSESLGLPVEEAWVAAIASHLKRLLDASAVVEASEARSDDLAPRFEP